MLLTRANRRQVYRERSRAGLARSAHREHGPGLLWLQPTSVRPRRCP